MRLTTAFNRMLACRDTVKLVVGRLLGNAPSERVARLEVLISPCRRARPGYWFS